MTKLAERLARNVRLNDRALVTKFGAAPAVLLVVFVMAAAVSVAALFYTQHAAQQIADHEIRVVAQLGGISGRFEHTEAELSRLLVDRAAGSRAEDVPRRVTTIQSELARIRADLLAIRPRLTAPQQHRVQGVVEQIDRYSEAITVVSSMLDVDFTATVTMLAPFRANADHVVRNLDGMVLAGVNEARAHADLAVSRASWSIGVAIVVLMLLGALGLAMAWLIGATVAASIVRIADATRRLAGGDHDLDLDTFARGDELGQIVSALKVFRAQAIEKAMLEDHALAEEQRRADAVAKANETSRRQRLAMIEELSGAFETKVQGMIQEVKVATHHVEVHAADLQATISAANGLANELEVLAQTFVDEMHEAGIATDELVGAIRRIDQDVDRTSRIATSIRTRAATASRRVSDSDRRAAEVERVVDVIDAIARQTNLLALNASIEAARCGEQGRGFAVVAGEVKALSGRTGSSTDEVRQQVRAVQDGMSEVVAETAALSALIEEMEKVAGSVSDASRAQAQSTGRIETRIRAVNERVETLSHVSAGIRTAAHGNERSLMALRTDSDKLQRALTDLSADARSFTGLLRAG